MNKKRWTALFWLLLLAPVLARVGGGQSYSGGGSSYSSHSGGGGGGGDGIGLIIELVIRLIFYYPKIGIPLVIGVAVWWWYQTSANANNQAFRDLKDWSAQNTVQRQPKVSLDQLKAKDPNFSETLFLDLLNAIYTRGLQGSGQSLAELGAYLSPETRSSLEQAPSVEMVVVGAVRLINVRAGQDMQSVTAQFESNVSLASGPELFVVDEVVLQRRAGAGTPKPEIVYALSCPHCGSNSAIPGDGVCPACGEVVNDGRWSWVMTSLNRRSSTSKPPVVISDAGEEIGTDLPTVRSNTLAVDLATMRQRDPDFDDYKFKEFAKSTFLLLQEAWTALDWDKVRPLETDYLFQQHQYWIRCYKAEGVRNVLEEVAVTRVELAKVSLDRYFDALTVRIFARMKDYTVNASDGKVLSGSPDKLRHFSEYWTFVRRSGVTSKDRDATRCPNCGAPLDKVTHSGDCEYCHTRITRGDFDWILSRIEQDEAYY